MSDSDNPYFLEHAQLEWSDESLPRSIAYDDIYFSQQQGLAETDYVFLQHNQLAERWQALDPQQQGVFTIAETGFGSGLNFLAAWQLWQKWAPSSWRLHYISVEKHPLLACDLKRALNAWPNLHSFASQLIEQYPALVPGHHLLGFDSDRISLHLLFGEAQQGFEACLDSLHPTLSYQVGAKVDAWFLDGFAPSKNPSMWTQALFKTMAQLSRKGSTVATFTAAGFVRRGLNEEGFRMQKTTGFAHKREMMFGEFEQPPSNITEPSARERRHQTPWPVPCDQPTRQPNHVAIIGAGIAGCNTAFALAKRGIKVTLIERNSHIASEASGNAQGMLYTKLSTQTNTANQFHLSSYLYALRFYQQCLNHGLLNDQSVGFCGLLQLCTTASQQQHLSELNQLLLGHDWVQCLSAEQASAISGVSCQYPGYLLAGSGWLSPPQLCRQLTQHPLINVLTHQSAINLQIDTTAQTRWSVMTEHNQLLVETDAVIIANSHDAKQFSQTAQLPLKIIRGQVTEIAQANISEYPKTVICHEAYVTPAIDGQLRLGATFDIGDRDKTVRSADHRLNLNNLHQTLPSLLAQDPANIDLSLVNGRANLRCTSPDYLPLIGPVPNVDAFTADYAALAKDANRFINQRGIYYPGLYINVAHGSRGLTSTPLASELLAALLCNEPRPLPRQLIAALNPARFIIRDIIRGKIKSSC